MRFVCDAMLGKLAKYLRIFGLDATYAGTRGEFEKYAVAEGEQCRLFTRRTHLKARSGVVYVKSDRPGDQLREIWQAVSPYVDFARVMTRCIECNVMLVDTPKDEIGHRVPEFVLHRYERFKACPSCGKVYWEGTHAAHMSRFIEEVGGGRRRD